MKEQIELLKEASDEIRSLRNQNNLMAARLDMFDKCVLLLTANLNNHKSGMMHPDLVWEIDEFISKNEPVINKP